MKFVIRLVVWVVVVLRCFVVNGSHDIATFNRSVFPDGFLFGAASAAFQYEGATFEDGRGPSIWDNFTHQFPGKILNQSTADVADNFYHLYKEDVKLMKFVGLDAFRFSISWSRILPCGKLSGGVNKEGVAFYNNFINELLSNGIKPFVTLHHWDTPQELEDEYDSFLSPRIVDDYSDYAGLCFKEFGDRVKHWVTFNEPYIFSTYGYDDGTMAPGRCSAWVANNCPAGDSATEPYMAGHNILLAHAAAVKLYKQKYQATQKGEIGITLVSHWFVPYSSSKLDATAQQRALDFMFGWFMDPLIFGDYPKSMRKNVQKRMPRFTPEQKDSIKGSFDFIGINYYTAKYAAHETALPNKTHLASSKDSHTLLTFERNGHFIGEKTGCSFYYAYPKGFTDLLAYTKKKYNSPPIYITENGIGDTNTAPLKESINDVQRVNFYHRHLLALQKAMKMGVNVKGFFAWSFLDDFEWASGYTLRFGLCYVDFADGLKRYPKNSALWFKKFLHN